MKYPLKPTRLKLVTGELKMLEDPSQAIQAANENNLALANVVAQDHLIDPVAKLWCRSFGVSDPQTIERLKKALQDCAQEAFAAGRGFERVQSRLDKAAEHIIRAWFGYVLGREIPASGKQLALLRLAFLDCNYEGKWSNVFLARDFCVQELNAELAMVMIQPTPLAVPRTMLRQAI